MSTEPGTALERRETVKAVTIPSDDEIRRTWRLAEALGQSGMFPDVRSAAEAFAKILVGHDLGLSPTQALMGIHIVKGKPMIAATALGGFVKRTPGYEYEVTTHDENECSIAFSVDGQPVGISTFTMDDAVRAELVTRTGEGENATYKRRPPASEGWEKYPRNMLFARALSNGIKWYMPDATGGVAVYVEGELSAVDQPQLTAGTGSGEAQGLDLGPKVEKVLARAAELGHEAIADRATAEMALGGRSPEAAVEWVKVKTAELDEYEASVPPEAEVVEPGDQGTDAERAHALREAADGLEREAGDSRSKVATEQRAAAKGLREQAEALESGGNDE